MDCGPGAQRSVAGLGHNRESHVFLAPVAKQSVYILKGLLTARLQLPRVTAAALGTCLHLSQNEENLPTARLQLSRNAAVSAQGALPSSQFGGAWVAIKLLPTQSQHFPVFCSAHCSLQIALPHTPMQQRSAQLRKHLSQRLRCGRRGRGLGFGFGCGASCARSSSGSPSARHPLHQCAKPK